jgi:hypothetical protein
MRASGAAYFFPGGAPQKRRLDKLFASDFDLNAKCKRARVRGRKSFWPHLRANLLMNRVYHHRRAPIFTPVQIRYFKLPARDTNAALRILTSLSLAFCFARRVLCASVPNWFLMELLGGAHTSLLLILHATFNPACGTYASFFSSNIDNCKQARKIPHG